MVFWVEGKPEPQGSMKAFAVKKGGKATGKVAVTSANTGLKGWRAAVQAAAETAAADAPWGVPEREAIALHVNFYLPRPKSHYGTGRNADLIKPNAPTHPLGKPDTDKLLRAIGDALTTAGVLTDDATVVGCSGWKAYADGRNPGAMVTLYRMEAL